MEQIIERLRAEKSESEKEMAEWGRKEGLDWSKTASYDDLLYVLQWDCRYQPGEETITENELNEYFKELFLSTVFLNYSNDQHDPCWVDEPTLLFLEAWKESVEAFWEEVKDKI